MIRILKTVRRYSSFLFIAVLFPSKAFAQGLTLGSGGGTASLLPSNFGGYATMGARLILVFLLLYAGMVAFRAGFNWLYWEGNALKADENKKTLAKSLVFISLLFFILVVFRVWIGGDYSVLVF